MKSIARRLVRLLPVLALTASLVAAGSTAHAQRNPVGQKYPFLGQGTPVRLMGQIMNLHGSAEVPTGFTLQLGLQTWDVKIPSQAVIKAVSAEADVEGLISGDFAVVDAMRIKRVIYAATIQFDVQPVPPLRLFTGTIIHVTPDGQRFTVRIEQNKVFLFRLDLSTRYQMDSRTTPVPVTPAVGQAVQVLARRGAGTTWVAYDFDLRTSPFLASRRYL